MTDWAVACRMEFKTVNTLLSVTKKKGLGER